MTDVTRTQLAGYAIAGVLVLVLGVRYLHAGHGAHTTPEAGRRAAQAGVRVRPAAPAVAVVDVVGAVHRPGVYRLRQDQRVQDAVDRAGGVTRGADLAAINLAAKLTDGAQIVVPRRGAAAPAGAAASGAAPGAAGVPAGGPVNLNTATPEQLDALDGIGPTMARKILEYRQQHGGFGSVQELDRIPGIGPKRLAALKGKVTV
jgi:competence protein ComEA